MMKKNDKLSDQLRSGSLYGRQSELIILEHILTEVKGAKESIATDGTQDQTVFLSSAKDDQSQTSEYPQIGRKFSEQPSNRQRHYVFVTGKSGMGKSALVEAALQSQSSSRDSNGFPRLLFGKGKFEQKQHDARPFAALRSCVSDLCETFAEFRDTEEGMFFANRLKDFLDEHSLAALNGFAPSFGEFVAQNSHISKSESASQESLEMLKHALRTFLVTIACPRRPVVLCLDDMQWIDIPSLKLLEAMLNNSALKHFVFIGIYRDDEVESKHPLSDWIDTNLTDVARISVTGLSVETLVAMLRDAFGSYMDARASRDEHTSLRDLATVLHGRTDGNVFHLLQLLDYLQAEKLLTYSMSTFQWTWDIEVVKDRTSLSENLVQVVVKKIERLPKKSRETVLICSLVGFRFDFETLEAAVDGISARFSVTSADLNDIVASLTADGILSQAKGRIKFAHDKIFQAASELQEDASKLHHLIGKALSSSSFAQNWQSERRLFLCVDQLNLGAKFIVESEERLEVAKLNLLACKRACGLSAFLRASQHAESSIKMLNDPMHWATDHEILVELFSLKAELGYVLGNITHVEDATREVTKNVHTCVDKFRVLLVSTKVKFTQARYRDGLVDTIELLRGLGVVFPLETNEKVATTKYGKLRGRICAMTHEELTSLPPMTNKAMLAAMKILEVVWDSLVTSDSKLGDFAILMMVELSLDHGWSSESPFCLSRFAALGVNADERDFAIRMQRLSADLVQKSGAYPRTASVLLANIPVLYLTTGLPKLTDNALEAYNIAMRMGDIKNAMMSSIFYCSLYFYSGLPLAPLLADVQNFLFVMMDYGQGSPLLLTLPFFQCVSNLVGESDDILHMETDLLKKHRKRMGWKEGGVGQETVLSLQLQIAFYCNEIKLAISCASALKEQGDNAPRSIFVGQVRAFFFCLIEIWQWRADQRFKLRSHIARTRSMKEAKKQYSIIKEFAVEKKNFNLAHKFLILDAEMLTLNKSTTTDELKAAYDKAIAAATRVGFVQDAALAAHLASHALPRDSKAYWERASELYTQWGAKGVVHYVEKKQGRRGSVTLNMEEAGDGNSFMRGQPRYDPSPVKEHQKMDVEFSDDRAS